MSKKVAVLGYGAVGRAVAAALAARGDSVRIAQRARPASMPPGALFESTDLTHAAASARACKHVDAVMLCVGFPYDSETWERLWPATMKNVIAGCSASGARLIFADNLYMYGPQTAPLREDMPLTDYGRKPRVRAAITRLWQEAHAAGRVRATAVRASDFYGPGVENSVLTQYGIERLKAGKPALVPYSPDLPHDYTYVPDFARAMLTLLDAPDECYGQAWHCPNAPTRTLRDILTEAAALLNVKPRINVLPSALYGFMAMMSPPLRELAEMRFQTDRPYIVDTQRFRARFWSDATDWATGLRATA